MYFCENVYSLEMTVKDLKEILLVKISPERVLLVFVERVFQGRYERGKAEAARETP